MDHRRTMQRHTYSLHKRTQAGHAEEPLALAGVAGLATASTRVILAGDPKQLGPIVHSRIAAASGLGLSWMERLLSREPYVPNSLVSFL